MSIFLTLRGLYGLCIDPLIHSSSNALRMRGANFGRLPEIQDRAPDRTRANQMAKKDNHYALDVIFAGCRPMRDFNVDDGTATLIQSGCVWHGRRTRRARCHAANVKRWKEMVQEVTRMPTPFQWSSTVCGPWNSW